jgi:hypothetical protein
MIESRLGELKFARVAPHTIGRVIIGAILIAENVQMGVSSLTDKVW